MGNIGSDPHVTEFERQRIKTGQYNIFRLDISVSDTLLLQGGQRFQHGLEKTNNLDILKIISISVYYQMFQIGDAQVHEDVPMHVFVEFVALILDHRVVTHGNKVRVGLEFLQKGDLMVEFVDILLCLQ